MKAMVKAVIASLKAEKEKRGTSETATDEWFKEVAPSLLKIGAVTLAPSTEAGKKLRPDLPLPTLCCRILRRRRICRVRAVGDAEALSHRGRQPASSAAGARRVTRTGDERWLAGSRARPSQSPRQRVRPIGNPGGKQRLPAIGIRGFGIEGDRPFDQGAIAGNDRAQAHGALVTHRRRTRPPSFSGYGSASRPA